MVFALGAISLSNGIKGADFTETPRPRMIRQFYGILNLFACGLAGLAILAPFVPYVISGFLPGFTIPFLDPYEAVLVSAVIACVLAVVFYRVSLGNARELLAKAEI